MSVSVMRGADCNTDHRMLRAKLVVGGTKIRTSGDVVGVQMSS